MTRLLPLLAAGFTFFAANAAFAACSPKCAEGDVCRYNGNTGKNYCAPSKTNNIMEDGSRLGKDKLREPGAVGGHSVRKLEGASR